MLPLQGWNQINVARAVGGVWLFCGPCGPGGLWKPPRGHFHGEVTSMISRDRAGATLAPCSLGMVLVPRSPRMKLVWDVWHWGENFGNEVIPI